MGSSFQQYYLNNFKLPDDFKNIEIDTGEEVAINVYNNNKEIINEYFDNQFHEIYNKTERYYETSAFMKEHTPLNL